MTPVSSRAPARSPLTLAGVLAPLPVDEFTGAYLGKQFLYSPGERGRFAALLPWADLNRILRHHRLASPRLRLVREGSAVPPATYTRFQTARRAGAPPIPHLQPVAVTDQLKNGATLVIDSVDELQDPVGLLAEDLERVLQYRIQVNMYAGWRHSPGFDLHWDDHDVLVLQVSGRKHWRVYPMTREHPMRGDRDVPKPPLDAPVWDGVLEDGDVMYIPRGWWHVAVPMDEPTLHLTVGLHTRTGVDLLEWFGERMKETVAARRDLPRFASPEDRQAHAERLREEWNKLWTDSIVDEYLASIDAKAEPRAAFALPWSVHPAALAGDDWIVKWMPPRPFDLGVRDGAVRFVFRGKEWTFSAAGAPLLNHLQSARTCSYEELCAVRGSLDAKTVRKFIVELLATGLVTVAAR